MSAEFAEYLPHVRRQWREERAAWERRREDAWLAARQVAAWLRNEFHAAEIIVFGSLVDEGPFDSRSDIDLAVDGLSFSDYLTVLARVPGLASDFDVDIVDLGGCSPALREVILNKGVPI